MVILGLGSNLGDRAQRLHAAIVLIRERGLLTRLRRSSIIETPALLPEGAPAGWDLPFYNLAVSGETALSPAKLLAALKEIESALGRAPRERWAPREIDIDILAYNDQRVSEPGLVIPHPALLEREFALAPLAELEPGWRHPGAGSAQGRTARQLLAARFGIEPKLMGIINVTPDSFSDGGEHATRETAVARALTLASEGAAVLDVGAESTRPGATALRPDEEWQRLEPVLGAMRSLEPLSRCLVSVDTRHAATARNALRLGADWINDVNGLAEPEMRRVVADSAADVVVMHSLSVPADRSVTLPASADPVAEVLAWAERRLGQLANEGIARSRVIIDPGIGFGKTSAQSLALLRGIGRFEELGVRVLVGHSRKSFLSLFTAREFKDRDVETLGASLALAGKGVDYLRVHNVGWHARALATARALSRKDGA